MTAPFRLFVAAAFALAASAPAVFAQGTVTLDLLTDTFGGETAFTLTTDPGGSSIPFNTHSPMDADLADGFAVDGDLNSSTSYTFTWELPAGDYDFTITDSFGDGICCGFGLGSWTLTTPTTSFVSNSTENPFTGTSQTFLFSIAETAPVMMTDTDAIKSALSTGLATPGAVSGTNQSATNTALNDLGGRLRKARTKSPSGTGTTLGVSRNVRYLRFAKKLNIDYRVALGLAEGTEVEIVETIVDEQNVWVGSPATMLGGMVTMEVPASRKTKAVLAAPSGTGGKGTVGEKVVIEEPEETQWELFTSYDYGYYSQDNISLNTRGFSNDTSVGTAGLEYAPLPWLMLGAAVSHVESDTDLVSNLGQVDLDGQLYSVYATAFFGDTYLDVLYSYGSFDNGIARNTLLGSTARGDADSQSDNVAINLGHNFVISEAVSTGIYGSLNFSDGTIEGYTERGGGNANLIFPDNDYESLITRLGGHVTFRNKVPWGGLTTYGYAAWAHEHMPSSGTATASLQTSPFTLVTGGNAVPVGGFTASQPTGHAGTDWIELGLNVTLELNESWYISTGYEGQFARQNAEAHYGNLRVGYLW